MRLKVDVTEEMVESACQPAIRAGELPPSGRRRERRYCPAQRIASEATPERSQRAPHSLP